MALYVTDPKDPADPTTPAVRVGLGGEGILRTHGRDGEALAVIEEAWNQGIRYFDCARAYAGSESYYGLFWERHPERRAMAFQAGKSAMRTRAEAFQDLETTLKNMHTERLDLWQIHDVRTMDECRTIEGSGGALEAFLKAKASGRVGAIGVTGHHDPRVLTHAVENWPLDAVMMPVNPVEAVIGGFLDETLEAARRRNLAVIGMKVLGAGEYLSESAGVTPETLIRFALSQPVTVAVVGCSTPAHVRTLAASGKNFPPLTETETSRLLQTFRPYARRLAFYRGAF